MKTSGSSAYIVNNVLINGSGGEMTDPEEDQHSHMHSSLPILAVDQTTRETLLESISKSEVAQCLTQVTGNYWPVEYAHSLHITWLFKAYFVAARISLLLLCAFYLYLSVSFSWSIFGLCITLTIVLDTLSVVPAQFINQQRLSQKARFQDALVLNQSARVASGYGALFLLSSIIFLIVYMCDPPVVHNSAALVCYLIVFVCGELSLCGYLTFNLFVLLMDLKVASISIDQLMILAEKKRVTMRTFNAVRSDIKHRQCVSRYAADLIVVPCIASAIAIVVLFLDHSFENLIFVLILFKELIYVAVAFWYVAQVNEKADKLTQLLGADMWYQSDEPGVVSDTERISIVTSSMLDPIGFTLLFQRLSVQTVVITFGGFVVSVLVGIIKQAVGV